MIIMTTNQKRTSEKRKEHLNAAQKAYKKRKLDYEEKLNEQIKAIEQTIQNTKLALKSWANQIGKYHQQLKALSQQLETIKQQITMKQNKQNENSPQGGLK